MSCCINRRKPVPERTDRGGTLRYAWLRAPPLRRIPQNQPQASFASGLAHYLSFEMLDSRPHMRVGKGGRETSIGAHAGFAVPTRNSSICRETSRGHGAKSAFAHPTR